MKRHHVPILVVLALVAAIYWTMQFFGGPPSPGRLAALALSADAKTTDRVNAVVELALHQEPETLAQLQRVARETQDAEVLAMALGSMVKLHDVNSFDLYLAAMDHPLKNVRSAGLAGVKLKYTGTLPYQMEFRPDDPPEVRGLVTAKLKQMIEDEKKVSVEIAKLMELGSLPSAGNVVRDSSTEIPVLSPTPAVSPSPSPPSPAATPSPPLASAPPASPPPPPTSAPPQPGPIADYDYPGVHFVVWMCRVLALLVLVVEAVGAVTLMVAERGTHASSKVLTAATGPLTPEERMERLLAKMAMGLWTKIAMLVAGAISIVALLYAGEMIYLVVRVEQKIDYLRGK